MKDTTTADFGESLIKEPLSVADGKDGDHEILTLPVRISWHIIKVMIDRQTDMHLVRTALRRSRVVALLGPRQCGKTTLARQFVPADSINYFDLEDPQSLARLSEPNTALSPLKGLVVIDEVQRRPELFPLLRVLADRKPLPSRFLIWAVLPQISSATPQRPWRDVWKPCISKVSDWATSAFGPGSPLVARRFPSGVHRQERSRFHCLASPIPSDVSGTRHSPTGHPGSGDRLASLLEHAGPLPRPDLERRRARPLSP